MEPSLQHFTIGRMVSLHTGGVLRGVVRDGGMKVWSLPAINGSNGMTSHVTLGDIFFVKLMLQCLSSIKQICLPVSYYDLQKSCHPYLVSM